MNFGPSLDVGGGSGLGTRSFGNSVDKVSEYGLAVIGAVKAAGLIPVAKHWPGIGGGAVDPHKSESPIAAMTKLRDRDMIPFDRAFAAGLGAVMVSHAIIPDLTEGLPASLSRPAITGVLRDRLHFDGLVVTDSLGMGAVAAHYDDSAAAPVAIAAGADLALVSLPSSVPGAHQALVAAINGGAIPMDQINRSVGRVLTAKGITGDCPV
jgi:beta-N-acetylhexosaminidase